MVVTAIFETSWLVELGGSRTTDWLPAGVASPAAHHATVQLRIVQTADGFFLYSESDNSQFCGGDTCHESVAEAMAQAELQFGVREDRWQRVAA